MQNKLVTTKEDLSDLVSILEKNGYVVRKLPEYKSFTNEAVLAYFYDNLIEKFGAAHGALCKSDFLEQKNKNILKKLQNKLIAQGYTKKLSNFIAYKIIQTVFSNYDMLGRYKTINDLEDIFTEKGLWMLTKISESAKMESNPEWFDLIYEKMCSTEDKKIKDLKEQREKELLKTDGAEET